MTDTLMKLGDFRFAVDDVTYQTLKHSQAYRWTAQARLQRRPAQQFIGQGDETLNFSGVIYPQNGDQGKALQRLRELASQGQPLLLVDGLGFVWGQWVIVQVDEDQSYLFSNGVPRKREFQLTLHHYGEDS